MIGSVFALIGSYSILLLGAAVSGLERLLFLITVFIFSLFPTLLSTADTLSSGEGAATGNITQLTHVSKVFLEPKRREVFTDINMRVKRGEFVALAGPVGSGKTTLVNLLAGLERASSGSIQVLGKETTRLSGRELTALRLASLGLVPQVQNLMQEFTVSQNVELPLFFLGEGERESRLSRVQEVLVLMGINADAERKVADLSVGDKQLVYVARAMVKDAHLLVMDEPTASMDPLVSELILEMLRGDNALRAKTLIIATHDKRIIELATRTVRMNAKIQA